MNGSPESLSIEDLIRIACEGPIVSGLLDETSFEEYLNGEEPQACQ